MKEEIIKLPAKEFDSLMQKIREIFEFEEEILAKNRKLKENNTKLKEQNEWLASFAVHMQKQRNDILEKYTKLKGEENC
jgi:hypothetical protein